jgi:hypothetical protein
MTTPPFMHFVVRNVTYTITATGIIVTCYTNYPCHLFKRETNIVPQKHLNPMVRRGAQIGSYIDQCFVVFKDIEQEEAGDTYTHTFIQDPWPYCETRWFYFWGTVSGELSPSVSAIFEKHRTEPSLTTIQVWANYGGGGLVGGPNYHNAWNAYATPNPGPTGIKTGHEHWLYYGEGFWINRGYLFFDTSAIPNDPDIFIANAELHLYKSGGTDNSGRDWNLVIQNGQPNYPHHPFQTGDWFQGFYGGNGGAINHTLISGFFNIPLNPTGLTWITKGGETKFCLRNTREIAEDPPPANTYEETGITGYLFPGDPSKQPYLLITYGTVK